LSLFSKSYPKLRHAEPREQQVRRIELHSKDEEGGSCSSFSEAGHQQFNLWSNCDTLSQSQDSDQIY
jgi:hypothetical protein